MTRRLVLLGSVIAAISASIGLASPAAAQTPLPANTVAGTISSAAVQTGAGPTYTGATTTTPGDDTGTLALGSSRTVLNMNSLNLSAEDTLNVVGSASTDTLLIRVNVSAAEISGTINATNAAVWIVSPAGLFVSPSASVTSNGFLSSTGNITDSDFFNDTPAFAGATNSIEVARGAEFHGTGVFGFIAPSVQSGAVADGLQSDVVYGAARDFDLALSPDRSKLNRLNITAASTGTVELLDGVTGGGVSVATSSSHPSGTSVFVTEVEAFGPAASGLGDVVISAGGNLARDSLGRMQPQSVAGAPAEKVSLGSLATPPGSPAAEATGDVRVTAAGAIDVVRQVLSTGGSVYLNAAGRLEILGSGNVTTPVFAGGGVTVGLNTVGLAALATGSEFVNNVTPISDAVDASKWVVYAPDPSDITGGLNSGNTAYWGSTFDSRPPGPLTGNRYAFSTSPTLTFSSVDTTKEYGADLTGALAFNVDGYHGGVTGLFNGDTPSTAFSGSPSVTSDGAHEKAMVPRSKYPIVIADGGSLNNLAGYTFAFDSAGELDVVCTFDGACRDKVAPTFAFGPADWQTTDVTPTVTADGGFSGIYSLDCTLNGASATITGVPDPDYGLWAGTFPTVGEGIHELACDAVDGADNPGSGGHTVLVDKTAPLAFVSPDRAPEYQSGTDDWYRDTVTLTPGATDPLLADGEPGSGEDEATFDGAETYSTTGTHKKTDSSIADVAGNTTSASRTVKVDATDPTLSIDCPGTVYLNGNADVTVEASDVGSGLASDPSDSTTVDSSEPGPQTVTVRATDNVGNFTEKTCTTNVIYRFGGFRQPINADGSSIFKLGSTVPVKFLLTDANGLPVDGAVGRLHVVKLTNDVEGVVIEAVSTSAASTGNEFRSDGSGQYIFNLGTKSLSKGTWRLKASLDDGTTHSVQIALR